MNSENRETCRVDAIHAGNLIKSAAWENEIRQVNRKLEMQPSPSSSLAQSRDEAMCSLPVEKTHMHVEQTVRKVSKKPMKSKNQESHAIFQSMDGTSGDSQQKPSANRFGQFLASQQLKKESRGVCEESITR